MTKYIFVSGGVISGLGKGITTASIAILLKSRGIRVTCVKCDAYMNVDAGTIRPQEHGEVFVTDDGLECDQDIGNYERFLNCDLQKVNYLTNGQVYQEIIRKERAFEYEGEDVEIVPHVPEEMIRRFEKAGKAHQAEVVLIEIGGTVGEYQ
ncbi:CTP synthase, partial [Patescibacteria group bacterium]|nr:CTP synthase [Patescibacteria group bacterium]